MNFRITAATVATSAVLVAGCGGSTEAPIEPIVDETTPTTNAVPTQNQFINQADPICAETNAALANLGVGATLEDSVLATQQAQITRGMASALREIGEPTEDATTLNTYLDAIEKEARLYGQRATAAAEGDTITYNELAAQITAVRTEAATAATAYGFQECGGEGSAIDSGETTTTPTTPTPTTPTPTPTPEDTGSTGGTSGGTSSGGGGSGGSGGGSSGGTGGTSGGLGGG